MGIGRMRRVMEIIHQILRRDKKRRQEREERRFRRCRPIEVNKFRRQQGNGEGSAKRWGYRKLLLRFIRWSRDSSNQ